MFSTMQTGYQPKNKQNYHKKTNNQIEQKKSKMFNKQKYKMERN